MLIDLVNTMDSELVAFSFGIDAAAAMMYLADHVDFTRLPGGDTPQIRRIEPVERVRPDKMRGNDVSVADSETSSGEVLGIRTGTARACASAQPRPTDAAKFPGKHTSSVGRRCG
jgi:hypothetical protein